ncbi:hypothetical protein BH10ACT2_BH10ACT2_15490 [soil metagenome]
MDFIGVAWTGSEKSFQGFINKYSLSFPTISDDPGNIFARFGVPAQPALVVINANGDAQLFLGSVEGDELRSVLTDATAV